MFSPVADATVRSDKPTLAFGTATTLEVDGSPLKRYLMKFTVAGMGAGTVRSATLRILCTNAASVGGVFAGTGTAWTESTVTWNNQPAATTATIATLGSVSVGTAYDIDLTNLVTGDGTFGIIVTSTSANGASYTSREGTAANRPTLTVQYDPPLPSPTPSSSASASPSASPSSSPSVPPSSSPSVPPSDPVLLAVGDIATCTGTGDEQTAAVVQGISAPIATLGDHAYPSGAQADFANCFDPSWGPFKSRTMPAAGNHEYETANATPYYTYFGAAAGDPTKGYYAYTLGTWRIIVLNSNCAQIGGCTAGSPEETWLRTELAANSTMNVLAYWHQPRFSSGFHGSDATYQPFWQALYDGGADVVLNGHDHDYERFAPQGPTGVPDPVHGIREFVVGTGGGGNRAFVAPVANSEVRESATLGVIELTLGPSSYQWQFLPVAGSTFTDAGQGSTHAAPSSIPTASFTSSAMAVAVGAPITFTDTSTGAPTAWSWDFGDGTTSTAQSPSHSWATAGSYTVSLVVSNGGGQSAAANVGITVTSASDTQPPTDPTSFTATANGSSRVDLAWGAPTDNVGVFACDIFRNGSTTPVATVSGTAVSYADTGLTPSTTYSYTIQARDAAGNRSNLVGPATVTTGAGGSTTTVTLVPTADAYTDASKPTTNAGTLTSLRVDGSPIVQSYLTFNLTGVTGSIVQATLRVYANSALSAGYSVGGTGTAWTESGLTAANAPPIGPSVGGSGAFGAAVWTSVDVTTLVTSGGQVGLGLSGSSATAVNLASRESGANAPQLVLEVGP